MGGLSKPSKQYSKESYDINIGLKNNDAAKLEQALKDDNLTEEQTTAYEKKLADTYITIAVDELARESALTQAQIDGTQEATEKTAETGEAEPDTATAGERRIPEDYLPTNIQQLYDDARQQRRQILSQMRRAAQNGLSDRDIQNYEDGLKQQDQRINAFRIAREHSADQQYFAGREDFYRWLERASRGPAWEQLAKMEVQVRRGDPTVDRFAMARLARDIEANGDISDQNRIMEMAEVISAVESKKAQREQDRQQAEQAGLRQQLNRWSKESQRKQAMEKRRARKRAERDRLLQEQAQQEESQAAERQRQKQEKQKQLSERRALQKRIDKEHWVEKPIGPYHVWAGDSDVFSVSGTTPQESTRMHKLGGFFNKATGSWEFAKNQRPAVEQALTEFSRSPQPRAKKKRKRVYQKTIRKQARRLAAKRVRQTRQKPVTKARGLMGGLQAAQTQEPTQTAPAPEPKPETKPKKISNHPKKKFPQHLSKNRKT